MFSRWKLSYSRLGSDNVDSDLGQKSVAEEHMKDEQDLSPAPRKRTMAVSIAIICGIAILAFIGLLTNAKFRNNVDQVLPCGNSSAQAWARGCSFDQLMWSWYPKHCPHYANDEYLNVQHWKFYSDPYAKEVVDGTDWTKVLDNEILVYGERGEHLTHCIYMFLSLAQILHDGEAIQKDVHWHDIETFAGRVVYDQNC
ncbi:uncharacterized protein N7482_007123 [Penicillium canariense]|uniref:Uncharacterized protein n=1 Tax=Penicillium canariense TaxID=189055 RepID=A0A9W9HXK5_9EURO|nr:uncharacterized protein N7482_007123 [Penicillium canariense]KAJ5160119.1 hypothetical protein N7482_007123 [Penicillium canariense]